MSAARALPAVGWEVFDMMTEAELEDLLEPLRAPNRPGRERRPMSFTRPSRARVESLESTRGGFHGSPARHRPHP